MADDLLQAIQTGANLVNLGWQRQERMQQLRSQEALRVIQERHLAAQADMLAQDSAQIQQKMQMAQAQKEKDTADLLAANNLYTDLTQNQKMDEDLAHQQVISAMSLKNPPLAEKAAKVYMDIKKAGAEGKPRPLDPSVIEKNKALTAKYTSEIGTHAVDQQLKMRDQDLREREQNRKLERFMNPFDKKELDSIYKEKDVLQKAFDTVEDPQSEAGTEKRMGFMARMESLNKKAKMLRQKAATSVQSVKASVPSGRVSVLNPDGKLGHIPASQLPEALKAGYKQVEEPANDEEDTTPDSESEGEE